MLRVRQSDSGNDPGVRHPMSPSYGTTTAVTTDYVLQLNPSSFFAGLSYASFRSWWREESVTFLNSNNGNPSIPSKARKDPRVEARVGHRELVAL